MCWCHGRHCCVGVVRVLSRCRVVLVLLCWCFTDVVGVAGVALMLYLWRVSAWVQET